MKKYLPSSLHSRQRGVTLIEIMISMLIGLLLLAGVVSVYVSGKQTYTARSGMSSLQENGRVALRRIHSGVSRAGYPLHEDVEPIIFDPIPMPGEFTPRISRDEDGEDPNYDDAPSGDTITISYLAGNSVFLPNERPTAEVDAVLNSTDCLGIAFGGGDAEEVDINNARIVNSYFVRDGNLMCEGSGNPGQPQPIANAVDYMQVRYGVDTDNNGFADQYKDASEVVSSGEQRKVVSIQVALLVNSGRKVRDMQHDNLDFSLFNVPVNFEAIRANYGADTTDFQLKTRSYRVFTSTVPMRNRMPICDDC